MSSVTEVVVVGVSAISGRVAMRAIDSWLISRGKTALFAGNDISGAAGGTKAIGPLFAAGINYLDYDAFIDLFLAQPWDSNVTLLLRRVGRDDGFMSHELRGR